MLEKVFGMQYVLKSPEIELFGHFKVIWHLLDKSSFSTAVEDENMASIIAPWKDSVTEFAIDQLQRNAKCETTTVNFWSCQLFSWVEHLPVESVSNIQEQFIVPDEWPEPFTL